MKLKLIKIKKLNSGVKKYEAHFEKNGKIIKRKFGAKGMSDFTIHKNKERREKYITRHKKDLRTGDPTRAGFLSMYILWNKPSFKSSLADYKKRLNTYNKTGKFPVKITGSKVLKFGVLVPYEGTYFEKLPYDLFHEHIQKPYVAPRIQRRFKMNNQQIMTPGDLKRQLYYMNKEYDNDYNMEQFNNDEPWLILDPERPETLIWINNCVDVIGQNELKQYFWYNTMFHLVKEIKDINPDQHLVNGMLPVITQQSENLRLVGEKLAEILNKINGIQIDSDEEYWYNDAYTALNDYIQSMKRITQFGKIPDNVINKTLYSRIKEKIKRDVKKKKRRWGAYDSGRLVREYKDKGGKYKGSQKNDSDLSRWYKEKWIDACSWPRKKSCGRTKSKEKIAYCRPSVKVDSRTPKLIQNLSKSEIKRRCKAKKKNPKKIIK